MNRNSLEVTLRNLPAPPEPSDLRAHCAATIPVSVSIRRKPVVAVMRWAALTIVLVAAAFWSTRSHPVHHEPGISTHAAKGGSNAAWAETVQAMRETNYWSVIGFMRYTRLPSKLNPGPPCTTREWFDAAHGYIRAVRLGPVESADYCHTKIAAPQILCYIFLSTGESYVGSINRISELKKSRYEADSQWKAGKINDLSTVFRSDNLQKLPWMPDYHAPGVTEEMAVAGDAANWRGVRALLFRSISLPRLAQTPKVKYSLRHDIYVDPATRRLLSVQDFAYYTPSQQETLHHRDEFDYNKRPDPALFDRRTTLEMIRKYMKELPPEPPVP